MPTVQTPVAEIAYRESGRGDGPTVLMLHGFPDTSESWDETVARMPGVHAIRPDLRGFGGTHVTAPDTGGGAQLAALAQDALDLLDALEVERCTVVGHAWGARVAHALAVLSKPRVSGLVTLATPYGTPANATTAFRIASGRIAWYQYWLQSDPGRSALAADALGTCLALQRTWSPAYHPGGADVAALERAIGNDQFVDTVSHYYAHRLGVAPGLPRYAIGQALLDREPQIDVPATFLYGLDDGGEFVSAARESERYYEAQFRRVEIAGAGHFLHRERPDLVADAVVERVTASWRERMRGTGRLERLDAYRQA